MHVVSDAVGVVSDAVSVGANVGTDVGDLNVNLNVGTDVGDIAEGCVQYPSALMWVLTIGASPNSVGEIGDVGCAGTAVGDIARHGEVGE